MNFAAISNTLNQLKEVINQLTDHHYICPIPALSNATVGEHTRHIIELFQTIIKGYENGVINYDQRERNHSIQTVKSQALFAIDTILAQIEKGDKKLILEHSIAGAVTHMETNYFREVLYNLEHCIHHQALIKVALLDFNYVHFSQTFGVAPSTLAFRETCAQ